MSIAYLVNQYPKASHSFVRREIQALEGLGVKVLRYAIRAAGAAELVDPRDQEERERTYVLIEDDLLSLFAGFVMSVSSRPVRAMRGLLLAVGLGRRSDRGVILHCIYWAEALHLGRRMNGDGVVHIHAHFGTNSATVAMLISDMFEIPFSFTVHGPEEFDKPVFIGLPDKIERAAFVVGVSSFGRAQLQRWAPYSEWPKIQVVHCGLEEAFYSASVTPLPDDPRLVCVGRLCEQKAQALLVEAVRQVRRAGIDVHLTLAGDGEMRPEIERLIAELRLEEAVTITGWVSSDEVRLLIEQSRALVLVSFAEGLPVALMEGMALARPVLTTYVAGIPELVKQGDNGWLVPAGDVDAAVAALKEICTATPQRLEQMGRRARDRVLERHDATTEARKLQRLFEDSHHAVPSQAASHQR